VVEAGVLPDETWFFGYEDFDFCYKLRRAGFRLLVDRASAASSGGQMTSAGRDSAIAGERPVDADEPWRAYYQARNFFLLSRRHGNLIWLASHLLYSGRRMQLAASWPERTATLRGLWDGLRGRTGCNPRFVRTAGELERQ
jgi:GT2 family glycosyltransferase